MIRTMIKYRPIFLFRRMVEDEDGRPKTDDGGPETEARSQKPED